ncbi:hypothetical protein HPP92_028662, partial [Vanilla planifolia]
MEASSIGIDATLTAYSPMVRLTLVNWLRWKSLFRNVYCSLLSVQSLYSMGRPYLCFGVNVCINSCGTMELRDSRFLPASLAAM